ncbi:dihydrolipoyl dehydrogenase family protein [Ectothiorhodospira lacustris]|uniref:dihydrolipoyl dehydrogenase family protein n=1 Tax=Ectothiorhodospira lacustris TaxID=2899127 RepID=UPI001EE8AEA6|nr:NAD(P)/FAD-dependent oxidoreductase [Ectothiorhodospira lacustris]MCG5500634.1 NAD(P)/FAD-dependent oxidoreductase [Ectothiorhodospira lacustris]MCG5508943.1 NAD(P)/FAD-dependent oxidoreductase [Ectothiorhodospira lacustris]MCG5520734.1 NAD(P)/FAD-dependent oxidoreductase [Ectothiorhodospira lacustris]
MVTADPLPDHDLAVIGSGPGGYRAAVLGALRGLSVVIIEKSDWGGCCLNRGCVPKKDWYHTARLMAAQAHFAGRGLDGRLRADLDRAWQHQRRVVEGIQARYLDYLRHLKVTRLNGHARFLDDRHLSVDTPDGPSHRIRARHIIIATGGHPAVPTPFEAIPGKILTTDMLFDAPPPAGARVAVIGSGVVATEFAYIFSQLGRQVTWLARSPMLRRLPLSRPARDALTQALARQGLHLRSGIGFEAVTAAEDDVRLHLTGGETLAVDWVCLGTGRRPHTGGLALERAGVRTDPQGFIRRNDLLQTDVPHIYAIGDVACQWMTANHALAEATAVIGHIRGGQARHLDPLQVPMVVYSALELARLGMDEAMAEEAGHEPAVGFAAFETSPCALGQDDTEGFVRLIADMDTGALLGGEILGAQAGELIHLLSLAPDRDTALAWIARGAFNHPSRAEEILNAAETLAGKWGLEDRVFGL